MCKATVRRSTARRVWFERCEDRVVFSGWPMCDAAPESPPDLMIPQPVLADSAFTAPTTPMAADWSAPLSTVREVFGFLGSGQTVAVIDSGIAYDHVALGGGLGEGYQVVAGWDFTEENDADPYDDGPGGFHGTHVAGIIASRDATRSGVAPGVDLVALRVFNDSGVGYLKWVERALTWVYEHRDDFRYPITTVNLSLGSPWNGSAPPSWAILEEELARLAQVGIFVAVAAGNRFQEFGRPGLAYPAASPHVVPVASVGADGNLSRFSQRDRRVIGAPGERVMSTIPDHVYGGGGACNDWATLSGTSMAAPYVAGASVLVREAMQFAGAALIDQWDIYAVLRDTADRIFDPLTAAWYDRLNLPHAIDAVMPPDDYGSTPSEAHDLGPLSATQRVSGHLGRLDDRDYFQFTAAASGHLAIDTRATQPVHVALVSPTTRADSEHLDRFPVTQGQTYTLAVSAQDRLAHYDLRLTLTGRPSVHTSGAQVYVTGTPGDDAIRLAVGRLLRLQVNEQTYYFSRTLPWRFTIVGGGGQDTLTATGGPHTQVVAPPGGPVSWTGTGYQLSANGFHQITLAPPTGPIQIVRLDDNPPRRGSLPNSIAPAPAPYGPQLPAGRSAGPLDAVHDAAWRVTSVESLQRGWAADSTDQSRTRQHVSLSLEQADRHESQRPEPDVSDRQPGRDACDPGDPLHHPVLRQPAITRVQGLHNGNARRAEEIEYLDTIDDLFKQLGAD